MDQKKRRPSRPRYERPGVVDILVAGDGLALERTLASLRLARCHTPARVVVVPPPLPLLPRLWETDRDVVLLRAGTEVGKGWLDRLTAAAGREPGVGSVIPFSSSGPWSGYPTPHGADPEAQVALDWARLDGLAATANAGGAVDVPFPAGCCIHVRREFLDDLAAQGAAAHVAGWRHLLAADVVVRWASHPGDLVCAWPAELPAHPLRATVLASYQRADAARWYRRRLDLARLQGPGPAMLLVTHVGGGGTERHIRDMAHALEDEGVRAVVFRPKFGGGFLLQRFPVGATPNLVFDFEGEYYELLAALSTLGARHIHMHHTLGFPKKLRRLIEDLNAPYDFTLHDYHLVCPRIHFSDRTGRYCGEPVAAQECNTCLARNGNYYNVRDASEIESWRAAGYPWLAGARRVFVPHADVGERLARYFPDIRTVERRHPEALAHARFVAAPRQPGQPLRVALLGTLVAIKGTEVLLACARDAARRALPLEFAILGTADLAADLRAAGVTITGEYREEEIYDLLQGLACHCALFLTLLPETYCYTLSIALAGGLYCLAFDIGAQGARVLESGWGEVLPLDSTPEEINDRLLAVGERLHHLRPPAAPVFARYPSILRDYYGLDGDLKSLGGVEPAAVPLAGRPILSLDRARRPRARRPARRTGRITLPLVGHGLSA